MLQTADGRGHVLPLAYTSTQILNQWEQRGVSSHPQQKPPQITTYFLQMKTVCNLRGHNAEESEVVVKQPASSKHGERQISMKYKIQIRLFIYFFK